MILLGARAEVAAVPKISDRVELAVADRYRVRSPDLSEVERWTKVKTP